MAVDAGDLDLPEIDAFGGFLDDPYPILREARERHWLARSDIGYMVLTYDAVQGLLRHPDLRFASVALIDAGGGPVEERLERSRRNLLHGHGDPHARLRKLVNKAFTPRVVERVREDMRVLFDRILDPVCARGECEFVAEVAYPYPPQMICALLGVDLERWEQISEWVEILFSGFDLQPGTGELQWETQLKLDAEMLEAVQRKRADRNARGPDLISDLIEVEVEGMRLDDVEIATLAENIITAGMDTTRNELGCGLFDLLTRPEQLDRLRADRGLMGSAVEEILRYQPVVPGTLRETLDDVVYDGVRFPKGSVIAAVFAAANRDPAVYPDPDTFDVGRRPAKAPMSFGAGPHFCLGAALARTELAEALDRILDRMPSIELACAPTEVEWKPMVGIGGPRALPIRFEAGH